MIDVKELYSGGQILRDIESYPHGRILSDVEVRAFRFIKKFPSGTASVLELDKKYKHTLNDNRDIVWIASKRYQDKCIGYAWAGLSFASIAKVCPSLGIFANNITPDNCTDAYIAATRLAWRVVKFITKQEKASRKKALVDAINSAISFVNDIENARLFGAYKVAKDEARMVFKVFNNNEFESRKYCQKRTYTKAVVDAINFAVQSISFVSLVEKLQEWRKMNINLAESVRATSANDIADLAARQQFPVSLELKQTKRLRNREIAL